MKNFKNKIIGIWFAYAIIVIFQIFAFAPYTQQETYISDQGVPHTITIARGWDNISDIGYVSHSNNGRTISTKQLNIPYAFIRFILTTGAASAGTYLLYKNRKKKTECIQQSLFDDWEE